jgi:hypothetical protein
MPYIVRKIRNQPYYSVKNPETGHVHSQHTTRKNALAQVRLLQSVGGMRRIEVPRTNRPSGTTSPLQGDVRRHGLFRAIAPPAPAPLPVFAPPPAPPKPPTPELPPARPFSLGYRADEFLRQNPQIAMPPPAPRQPRAPRPTPYASASSASSASSSSASSSSSFQSPHSAPAVILLNSDVKGILDNFKASGAIPEQLNAIYQALSTLGLYDGAKRLLYAAAMYNLGYTSRRRVYNVNTSHQMRPLLDHITANLKTIIPASRGGKKHGR